VIGWIAVVVGAFRLARSGLRASTTVLPQVVACDLDGTLLRSDGSASARSRRALAACEAAGALVVLCTARPVRWVRPLAAGICERSLAICDNGAVIWDMAADRLVAETTLSSASALEVVAALDRAFPGGAWAVERTGGFGHEPMYTPRWPVPPGTVVAEVTVLLERPPIKLLFSHRQFAADEMLGRARAEVGGHAELTHSNSADGLLEISASGINKASTLARLCAERGVAAADVIAFGDMPNDLPMLEWAGRPVAVANAHADVLAAVAEVTASNDEDGVAIVLERACAFAAR
jgi:hydroxymethylpyrimidine pyrophosphatase-like HAD family hydrolase